MKRVFLGIGGTLLVFALVVLVTLQFGLMSQPVVTAVLGLRYPDRNPEQILPTRSLATFTAGTFLEGVLAAPDGSLYLSGGTGEEGTIWRYVDGSATPLVSRPGFFGTLARNQAGVLYATYRSGRASDPAAQQWQVVTVGTDTTIRVVTDFPQGAQPNGMAFDAQDQLYVADSALGRIWRLTPDAATPEVWLESALLMPQSLPGIPGANGLRWWQNALYVTNSSTGDLVRVPLAADRRAGTPTVVARGVTGDDFAFDASGNAFITTHPYNVLVEVAPDGTKTTVGTAASGMVGATSAAVRREVDGTQRLYVVTDGGAFLTLVPYPFNRLFPQDVALPSLIEMQLPAD
ncbi:hypothetical protein HC891_14770 [Candidatus Gracilibacteria bacterium]|nr:hypothetical protein [Candidatus Gracilibacteria bacterium]